VERWIKSLPARTPREVRAVQTRVGSSHVGSTRSRTASSFRRRTGLRDGRTRLSVNRSRSVPYVRGGDCVIERTRDNRAPVSHALPSRFARRRRRLAHPSHALVSTPLAHSRGVRHRGRDARAAAGVRTSRELPAIAPLRRLHGRLLVAVGTRCEKRPCVASARTSRGTGRAPTRRRRRGTR